MKNKTTGPGPERSEDYLMIRMRSPKFLLVATAVVGVAWPAKPAHAVTTRDGPSFGRVGTGEATAGASRELAGALGLAGAGLVRRGESLGSGVLRGVVAWLGALVMAAAAGFVLTLLLAFLAQDPRPWFAHPLPTRGALWLLTVAAVILATLGNYYGLTWL